MDFHAEELVIPANLSRDPSMINPLKAGEDFHRDTALRVWGEEQYSNDKRQLAKIINFGALYGGTAWAFHNSCGIPLDEAEEVLAKWWMVRRVLKQWSDRVKRNARRTGMVFTAFGRPRHLEFWYNQTNYKSIGFANRSSINSIVQGTGADIMRLSLCRIQENLVESDRFGGDFYPLTNVHDEINFSIAKEQERFTEITLAAVGAMDCCPQDWEVRLKTEIEVGPSYGMTFAFEFDESNHVWTPKVA
jgi:DNA polymerase-1